MRSGRNKANGHTLIEVLLALAIVALLATAGVQSWQQLLRSQRRAEGRTALLAVLQQQERHFSRYGRYQPFDAAAPGGFKWHSGPTPADSAYGLSAVACAGETVARCVMAVAQPGSAGATSGFADPVCGALTLDSRGRQQAGGGLASCW
jgi:type IV pilus assembly protein PilE